MRYVGIDTETFLIEPGNVCPRLVCMSVAEADVGAYLEDANDAKLTVYQLITDPDVTLIGHNIAFDLLVLAKPWGYLDEVFAAYDAQRIRDTGIRQRLLDIAQGRTKEGLVKYGDTWLKAEYSLLALERIYLGLSPSREAQKKSPDAWRLRYSELANVPVIGWPEEAAEYAMADAKNTLDIFNCQGPDVPDEHEQTYAAWALHLISSRGIAVDKDRSEALAKDMFAAREKNRRRLVQVGFLKPKRLTPAQLRAGKESDLLVDGKPFYYAKDMSAIKSRVVRTYRRIGTPLGLTAKGGVPTDKDTLLESGSPLLALLSEEGGVDKIISTYLPILKSGYDSAICCGYEPIVNSGRCSSFRPNLQNIPSGRRVGGVRECFVPRPGYWLCSVDYDTLELRALAQVCLWMFGESKMAEALNAGLDLHLVVAAQLLGITYEEAVARKKDPEVKRARDTAKPANFGFPGGMGISKFILSARKSYGVRVTEQMAREVKAAWQQAWPEMKQYHNEISMREGEPILQLGTKRVRGGCNFTEGANTLFQGLAGSGAKEACVQVVKSAYSSGGALPGLYPVAMIHDEILAEVDVDIAHELAYGLRDVMVAAMQKLIPDVKITAEPVLMERWSKDAVQKFDADGKLTVWVPEEKK